VNSSCILIFTLCLYSCKYLIFRWRFIHVKALSPVWYGAFCWAIWDVSVYRCTANSCSSSIAWPAMMKALRYLTTSSTTYSATDHRRYSNIADSLKSGAKQSNFSTCVRLHQTFSSCSSANVMAGSPGHYTKNGAQVSAGCQTSFDSSVEHLASSTCPAPYLFSALQLVCTCRHDQQILGALFP